MSNYDGFEGISFWPHGDEIRYDPTRGFTLQDIENMMQSFSKPSPRRYSVFTGLIGSYLMSGNPELVKKAKKMLRIKKIALFRELITKYGAGIAKTMAILNNKMGRVYNNSWSEYLFNVTYKTINGGDDESFVKLIVDFSEEKKIFGIRIQAGYTYFGREIIHDDILNSNITYKSVLNQVNYFINKFKQ